MYTWSMWRSVRWPRYDHPLFTRLSYRPGSASFGSWQLSFFLGLLVAFFALLLAAPALLMLMLVFSPLLYVTLTASFFGLLTSSYVSTTIARERLRETYDVLCVTPEGALQMNWMIFTVKLHQESILRRGLEEILTISRGLGALAVVVAVVGVLPSIGVEDVDGEVMRATVTGCAAMIVLSLGVYVDYVQALLVGGMLALLIGNSTRSTQDARLWALGLFLTVQIGGYLGMLVCGIIAFPSAARLLALSENAVALLAPPLMLLSLALFREALLRVLWHTLATRLNAESSPPFR